MKFTGALVFLAFLAVTGFSQKYSCLPSDIKLGTVVGFKTTTSNKGSQTTERITVGQTLKTLKAKCVCGELHDGKKKAIHFYQLHGCWGYPPPDYLEIMEQQRIDLESLKTKYTVIEITCSSGSPQRIS